MRKGILTGVASLLLIAVVSWGFSSGDVLQVRTVKAERGPLQASISATGRVVSDREVAVSPMVSGKVTWTTVEEGDMVKAGQVLARLSDGEPQELIRKAEAEWNSARQAEAHAAQTRYRAEQLYEVGGESGRAVEDAKAEQRAAAGREQVLRSELRLARINVGKTQVAAPFSGMIIRKTARADQWAAAGVSLFTLADPGTREIEVKIDSGDSALVQKGQEAQVTSEAFRGKVWTEKVVRIAPAVQKDETANTFIVRLTLKGDAPPLRFGQQVDVKIRTASREDAIRIPFAAIISRGGRTEVATIAEGRLKFVPVVTGMEDLSHTEIVQGLAPGDEVVLPEGKELKAGTRAAALREQP
jgi:RND family efflux transporter MFP subunit